MLFDDVFRDFLSHIEHEKNLSPRTIRAYRYWNQVFSAWADKDSVASDFELRFAAQPMRRWLYHLSTTGKRPRTIHNAACSLRALGDFALAHGALKAGTNPARSLVLPKKDAADRSLAFDVELALLLAATERQGSTRLVARDRALFSVLIYCGVRFRELIDIRCQDVAADYKTILIASGKGRKSRTLYTNKDCRVALAEWVRERQKMKTSHDWLWAYDAKRRIGENGLRRLLKETKARAELSDRGFTFHSIRRAYATRLLAGGCDLRSISASLGHADPQTTLIYTFDRERPAEAMARFSDLRLDDDVIPDPTVTAAKKQAKPSRADLIQRMRRHATRKEA